MSESILDLARPLVEQGDSQAAPDEARRAIELAINLWNAHVTASPLWGNPKPAPLAALRKAMCGKQAPPGLAATFEMLSARWRKDFSLDPRLVGGWACESARTGGLNVVCQTTLPEGVEVEVPPAAAKRIALGGTFLDEVRIRQGASSYLSFPVDSHRGDVGIDGQVTIHAKMPTVVELFAEGVLMPVGGPPVEVMIGGKRIGPMALSEVRCAGYGGRDDVAVLVFRA